MASGTASEGVIPQFDFSLLAQLGIDITDVVADSRQVRPGDTFLAFPGERGDGRQHIGQAIASGASAVIWEREGYIWDASRTIPNLGVAVLRMLAGVIASRVYGEPSKQLWAIGVTGTNGKTSCAHWLAKSLTSHISGHRGWPTTETLPELRLCSWSC